MPRLRNVLPVVVLPVVVLMVAACGQAPSPSPSGTPVTSPSAVASSSPAASAGDVLVLTAGSKQLPAGTYTLVGWYEGEARITRSVVVPPGGWAEIDLVVP